MGLIDADKAIEDIMIRQRALKDRTGNVDSGLFTRDIERCIKEQPTLSPAEVRTVVFCRDCKHKGWVQEPEHGKSVDYCRLIERCVDKQFFCAAGERKTNCDADMREES